MALRSRFPDFPQLQLNTEQFRYLEGLDRRIPARDDLSLASTLAQTIAAYNTLLEDLRDAKIMERS